MKKIILGLAIVTLTFSACNANNNTSTTDTGKKISGDSVPVEPVNKITNNDTFSVKEIIAGYLKLKNALAKDNAKDAASAGNDIVSALIKAGKSSLEGDKQKTYADLEEDIKEHAEHIGANADKIEHQRQHFILLSKDMAELVKTFGNGGQTLYKDFCPMADGGKGAIWISEIKEIKNPYYGKKMSTCGSVKETIK